MSTRQYKSIVEALRETLREEMRKNDRVIVLGEDIGAFGGAYRVTEGLFEEFGPERVLDTPISETGIIGAAIGSALTGLHPVAEIQFNDFYLCAMDQICNQAAKIHLMSGGQASVPIIMRAPIGATGRAAQHSQSLEALFMHMPGLKIVMPATPYDARGLLKTAFIDENPVMFFEHKLLYGAASPGGKAKSAIGDIQEFFIPAPEEEYTIPFGQAVRRREGRDLTVVATSYMVLRVLKIAKRLETKGISLEVIDPRTLVPLDKQTIFESVKKTGRLLIVHEGYSRCGFASELTTLVIEEIFDYLDAPVKRVCTMDVPIPFAPNAENYVLPNETRIENAINEFLQ